MKRMKNQIGSFSNSPFFLQFNISLIMIPIGKNFAEVEFRVKAEVPHGVTLRLSGSVSQLGYSSPSNSIPLYTSPTEFNYY